MNYLKPSNRTLNIGLIKEEKSENKEKKDIQNNGNKDFGEKKQTANIQNADGKVETDSVAEILARLNANNYGNENDRKNESNDKGLENKEKVTDENPNSMAILHFVVAFICLWLSLLLDILMQLDQNRSTAAEPIVSNEEISCTGCKEDNWCRYKVIECTTDKQIENCGQCSQFPCDNIRECFEVTKSFEPFCKQACTEEEYVLISKAFFEKEKNLKGVGSKVD